MLAHELLGQGHVVRGTTRQADGVAAIAGAGAEAVVADPDRVATLAGALEQVGVVFVLLGSAEGDVVDVSALHGSRLEMLLSRTLDTTIRGIVYEAAGSVDAGVLRAGAALVREVCEGSKIPFELLERNPRDGYEAWVMEAVGAAERVLIEKR
jgi:uncharacterized protein YbjT (DUF2867 family)